MVAIAVVLSGLGAAGYGQRLLGVPGGGGNAVWLLFAGVVSAALATILARWRASDVVWADAPGYVEVASVTVLFVVGAWIRIAGFDRIPAGMNHDAAWNGMYATSLRFGAEFSPYAAAAWGRETLFMYSIAPFQSWLGGSAAAVEAASIAAGLAALIPLYLLARDLFGRFAGIAALGFFSVSGWHWVFSQAGWRCITVPPLETLALFFLWRSLRRGGAALWLCCGAFAGASIYTYNAARIVPPMIGVLALWYLALHRDRWRSILRGGTLAALSFLAVGGSMLWYAANNWVKFQGRAAHLLDQSQREIGLIENLSSAFWMFNFSGNGNDFFVQEPLLEPLAGVLFLFGLALLIGRIGRTSAQFVLGGFLLSLIPGLLSFPNGNRCITAMPFVYVTVGYGAAELARLLGSAFRGGAVRWVSGVVVLACLVQATAATYANYLGTGRRQIRGFSPEATAVGEYLGRFGEDYRVYAVSGSWPRYTLSYLGFTHGDPLEPEIVIGRSFKEVENQLSRFGRKGLVLVGDLSATGAEAREGIKQIFADAREESVRASRLGGAEVARAVIVEPRQAVRTAPWSNRSRVLAVFPGDREGGKGVRCVDARPTAGGFSARVRMMVPDAAPAAGGFVGISGSCRRAESALRFTYSTEGLVVDGPTRRILVEPSALQSGRWHDLGLSVDAQGKLAVMIDGETVELGAWVDRPDEIGGFVVSASGQGGGSPTLYVDDFATIAEVVPADNTWWQVASPANESRTRLESFEGLPVGDLSGRPGWHGDGVSWEIRPGPAGSGPAAVVATNGFDGGRGRSPGKFDEPMGVGMDTAGNIYVCERLNHRMQKFAPDGTFLGEWGVLGAEPGEFREPLDVSVVGERVYVMDTWNTRLQVFDLTGNYLFQIGPDPEIGKPRGIFVRGDRIYLANSGRDNILVFDHEGALLAKFPPPGTSTLEQIVDLVVDSQGRIYVNNSQVGRLEVFSAEGERVGTIAVPGWDASSLKEFYMAIDADDVIYVTDWNIGRVRRFRTDGSELPPIGPRMSRPSGLAVQGDRVVVAARGDNALRVVELRDGAAE